MRTPPKAPPPVEKRMTTDIITQVRQYELITPLFGGGVKPAEADPVTVIRGASIRGQLRFWWRATQGGRFNGDLRALKEAEDLLWGAASTAQKARPSQVQIALEVTDAGRPFREQVSDLRSPYGYFGFPLLNKSGAKVIEGVKFTLTLSFPRDGSEQGRREIEASLWAWETFGGIGARTRRGFGALQLVSVNGVNSALLPTNQDSVVSAIKKQLASHVVTGVWPSGVPHLSPNLLFKVTASQSSSLQALQGLVKALRDFRQQRNPGIAPNRPGRSKWPEPDAVRRLSGASASVHKKPLSSIDKFPRAEFGLPIIFKFKDDRFGDPSVTTLKGSQSERLASPLILRPLLCGNGRAVGLAAILQTERRPPGGLVLTDGSSNWPVRSDVDPAEAARIPPLHGETDVLLAFLKTLK